MSLAQILANVEQLQKEQADIYDSNQRFSEEKLPIEVPSGGGIFTSRFENFAPRFGGITDININPQLTEEESIAEFLQTKEKSLFIQSVFIANGKLLIVLDNSYLIKLNINGKIENINKLPAKIKSPPIFISSTMIFLDKNNKINILN